MTLLPYNEPDVLTKRDLLSYIDNQGAMEALIKGYSSGSDTAAIACVFHLMAAKLAMRVFFEHVFSDSNISDGMSRLGLQDFYAKTKWESYLAKVPDLTNLSAAPLRVLQRLFVDK